MGSNSYEQILSCHRVDPRSEGHHHPGKQQEGLELFSFVKLEEKLGAVPIHIKVTV